MKKCKACCREIEDGASKCLHCDSQQNWRRHLGFSSTILSLLIALGSVTALAIQNLADALHQPSTEVTAAIVYVGQVRYAESSKSFTLPVHLAVSNGGDRGGILLSGDLRLSLAGRPVANGAVTIDSDNCIVQPLDNYIVRTYVTLDDLDSDDVTEQPDGTRWLTVDEVALAIRVLRHDRSEETLQVSTPTHELEII